jgi:hypothetical protein
MRTIPPAGLVAVAILPSVGADTTKNGNRGRLKALEKETSLMKKIITFVALATGLLSSACSTMPGDSAARLGSAMPMSSAPSGTTRAEAEQPWQRAQAVVNATVNDVAKNGIRAIGSHVTALEEALSRANRPFGDMPPQTGDCTVLVDGQAENLGALLAATGARDCRRTTTVANPYPSVSFFLGTYYNEIGKANDALRALDAGLALPTPLPGSTLGQMRPNLISERGAALISLKRWPEALADYESGLAITTLTNTDKARLLRGRGFALTELGRLNDAEQSYRDSLIAEPNNPRAVQELNYIARIRAGGAPTGSRLITPNAQQR